MAGDRELLVPDAANRRELFPPGTVWPGGLMVAGELVGHLASRRRAHDGAPVAPIVPAERQAVKAEAATLPLPGLDRAIHVAWDR